MKLVDWTRLQHRSIEDSEYTFEMLRTECWRHEWWHREIDPAAERHARRKGREGIETAIAARLATKSFSSGNAFDGRQTPKDRNVIFYAQHATATCCRRCMEYWHGVPASNTLTNSDIGYFVALMLRYIDVRLPKLGHAGEYVPRRRHEEGIHA